MKDVIVERAFDPPATMEDFFAMAQKGLGCLTLYNIEWQKSFLSENGKQLVCHFRAADTETVRTALRQLGHSITAAWPATQHDALTDKAPNVLVERRFEDPVSVEAIQSIEDAGIGCLNRLNVTFIETLFSEDKKRMLCLYHAPDAESVRTAQREAGVPLDRVWACSYLNP